MTWLVIGGFLKSLASGIGAWLSRRSLAELAALALAILFVVQHFQLVDARHDAAKWQKQFNAEHAARAADREAYRKAQAEAHAANVADVAKKEAESKRISDDERQAYLSDLAQLRADNQRMRAKATQGSADPARPSEDTKPAAGADGDGLQVPPADDVREEASEIELRLMHLQNWVEKQLANDPNN
jgi:hypothetical protein